MAPAVDVDVAEPDSSLRCVGRVAAGRTVCSGRSRSQTQNVERERKKIWTQMFFSLFSISDEEASTSSSSSFRCFGVGVDFVVVGDRLKVQSQKTLAPERMNAG